MRLELESPFQEVWKIGYLQTLPTGRRYVCLFNGRKDRSLVSYARYLMSVKLGRFLTKDEHVDHIDEDKTNDSIDNLQVISKEENIKKNHKHRLRARGLESAKCLLECSVCQKPFLKRSKVVIESHRTGRTITCSRGCSAKLQLRSGRSHLGSRKINITDIQHSMIVELRKEGMSDYKISDILGIKRAKIQRYRKEHGID